MLQLALLNRGGLTARTLKSRQMRVSQVLYFKRNAHAPSFEEFLSQLRQQRQTTKNENVFNADFQNLMPKNSRLINNIQIDSSPVTQQSVGNIDYSRLPRLGHGLERILAMQGVQIYDHNYSSFLSRIHQPEEINFENFSPYIPPSLDKTLHNLGTEHNCMFVASTSSLTSLLVQMYFTFTQFRTPQFKFFTSEMDVLQTNTKFKYSPHELRPKSVFLRKMGNIYSIDANSGNRSPQNQILLDLGKSLEKMLTMESMEFNATMLKGRKKLASLNSEVYHYLKIDNALFVRSQLDCYSENHNITFDLKTRATLGVRIDPANLTNALSYRIEKITGRRNSFEKELYDMVRGVFLKYFFQVSLGKMGGIFVVYHNTQKLLGFEFFSKKKMESILFGNSHFSDVSFSICNKLLSYTLQEVTKQFPKSENLKLLFWTNPRNEMDIFVEELASRNDKGLTYVLGNSTASRIPLSWFKLRLSYAVNGKSTSVLGHIEPTDHLALNVELMRMTYDQYFVLSQYHEAVERSQLYVRDFF